MRDQLEQRTEVVLDTMTNHFDQVIGEVKAVVETFDWKVSGQANEIWWLTQNQPVSVDELVADIEGKLRRSTGGGAGTKKMLVRIPERTNLDVFAGGRAKDKEGFVA